MLKSLFHLTLRKESTICDEKDLTMNNRNFFARVWDLYYDGFRNMTLGRTLWLIILVKLFIIFVVLKLFFFPDFLSTHAEGDEAEFVSHELLNR